jgi:hypothetical protein
MPNNQKLKNMKTNLLKLLTVAAIGLTVMASNVSGQEFSGQISFTGGAYLNGPLATATAFTNFSGVTVQGLSQSGAYSSVPAGTPVTFSIFTFNPAQPSVNPLWTFAIGPTTYSFTATSISVVFQNSFGLDLDGNGIASITGFTDSPGTWAITDTGTGPVFTFGANVNVVPEPSALALILGFVPIALLYRSRKMSKKA